MKAILTAGRCRRNRSRMDAKLTRVVQTVAHSVALIWAVHVASRSRACVNSWGWDRGAAFGLHVLASRSHGLLGLRSLNGRLDEGPDIPDLCDRPAPPEADCHPVERLEDRDIVERTTSDRDIEGRECLLGSDPQGTAARGARVHRRWVAKHGNRANECGGSCVPSARW